MFNDNNESDETAFKAKSLVPEFCLNSFCDECSLPFEHYGYRRILKIRNDTQILRELCFGCYENMQREDYSPRNNPSASKSKIAPVNVHIEAQPVLV